MLGIFLLFFIDVTELMSLKNILVAYKIELYFKHQYICVDDSNVKLMHKNASNTQYTCINDSNVKLMSRDISNTDYAVINTSNTTYDCMNISNTNYSCMNTSNTLL